MLATATLAPALDTVRLTLHVLAAAVWVGGQIVMTGLVGPARGLGGDATKTLARAFARLAWPAFVVLIATGIWNITAVGYSAQDSAWKAVLMVKITVVILSGITAYLHQVAKSRKGLAVWGALTAITAMAALVIGVALAG